MRITLKYLTKWCQNKFKELEINEYEIISVTRTHFRPDDYEGGACFLHINYRNVNKHNLTGYFMCFYPCWQIQQHLENGYELYLKFDRFHILYNCQLDIRKK